jgi:hypothetical protein
MKTLLRSLVSIALLATASPLWSADVSINSLPAIGSVSSSTVLPVVDVSGTPTTKKATVTQLINGLPVATGSTVGTMSAADKAKLDAATDANTASAIVRRDASGNFTAGTVTAGTVTGLATPTNGSDAANKSYVDAAAAGLTVKQAARAATTANVTLVGGAPVTLDGLTLVASDRILVKNQATNTENGIYYVSTLGSGSNGTWTRTTDADTGAELDTGTYIFISSGTANANAAYTMVTQGPITLGTSPIVWALFSQVTSIAASSITGQLIQSQIQDAAINTAKFAAGLTPVEILGVLPTSGNFAGRQVFLTTNSKLYRYDGSAFTNLTPTADLQGTISAGQVAANAITAGTIAANAVTAGTVVAGAINTAELAAGAVNTAKLAAGAVTADKITVGSLSAISANVGTLTSGTAGGWTLASTKFSATNGTSSIDLDASNVWLRAVRGSSVMTIGTRDPGTGPESYVNLSYGLNRNVSIFSNPTGGAITVGDGSSGYDRSVISYAGITLKNSSNVSKFYADSSTGDITTSGAITMTGAFPLTVAQALTVGSDISLSGSLKKVTNTGWTPALSDGDNTIEFQWGGGGVGLKVRIDGSTVLNITTTP